MLLLLEYRHSPDGSDNNQLFLLAQINWGHFAEGHLFLDRRFAGFSAAADICHPATRCMMGKLMALSSYMGQLAGDLILWGWSRGLFFHWGREDQYRDVDDPPHGSWSHSMSLI